MHSVKIMADLAEYLPNYLQLRGIVIMFATAFVAVFICVCILTAFGLKSSVPDEKLPAQMKSDLRRYSVRSLVERYFELMVSGTIFLLFTSAYFMITYFGVAGELWDKYSSFILLGLIIVAVIFNAWFDKKLIPLEVLRPGEREIMHLIAILYMLVIFAYIKFVYQNNNYDSIIQYFILLIIGRFVGFDTTIGGIRKTLTMAVKNLPLLAMALSGTGLIALVGFKSGYLIVQNGVVWNLFLGQLFLVVIMYIIHKIRNRAWAQAERESRKKAHKVAQQQDWEDRMQSRRKQNHSGRGKESSQLKDLGYDQFKELK